MNRPAGSGPTTARPAPAEATATTGVPAAPTLHVLVAEDNELSAQVLEQLLIRQGHRVRLASNGREALAMAEEGGFDLLLLDVHMPELDGFQVVQAVRQRERTTAGHLPVIALTARSRKEDRERCLAAGMDDFLTKPVRPADGRGVVRDAENGIAASLKSAQAIQSLVKEMQTDYRLLFHPERSFRHSASRHPVGA